MKIKRHLKTIIFVIFIFSFLTISIKAYDDSYIMEEINIDELLNSIPSEYRDYIPSDFYINPSIDNIENAISFENILQYLFNITKQTFFPAFKKLSTLVIFMIFASLINTAKETLYNDTFKKTAEYITVIAVVIISYSLLGDLISKTTLFLKNMDNLIVAVLPIMTALYTMGGNIASAVVASSGIAFTINLMNTILQYLLAPTINICFGLCVAGKLGGFHGINYISKTIKNYISAFLVGITTLFSIYLLFRSNVSLAADSISVRTIKFAGSFIPVIGSALGETVRSIISGLSLIKNSVGLIGIVIVLFITLPTLVYLSVNKISLDLIAGFSYILGCKTEGDFLKDFSSIISFALAITLCVCILFIFELTIFISISPALGGA